MAEKITIESTVNAPVERVWKCWNEPACVMQWNHASDDWHSPKAENDLREGGKFVYRMEAKDGSFGFDFGGTYSKVVETKEIAYSMDDARAVTTSFTSSGDSTTITTVFDAENENPIEMQKQGWQAILENFKKHVESHN